MREKLRATCWEDLEDAYEIAKDPKTDPRLRFDILKWRVELGVGKPAQAITGDDGGPIQVAGWDLGKLTDEQFRAVVDALKATKAP